jgi:hypothetical protein
LVNSGVEISEQPVGGRVKPRLRMLLEVRLRRLGEEQTTDLVVACLNSERVAERSRLTV